MIDKKCAKIISKIKTCRSNKILSFLDHTYYVARNIFLIYFSSLTL